MYNVTPEERDQLKEELKRYYDKIDFKIYNNKQNCMILDFS